MRRLRLAGELVARGIWYYWLEQTVDFISFHSLDCSCLPRGIRLCKGRPIRGRGRIIRYLTSISMEREVFPDVSKVSIGDQSSLPKTTLALAVLALQQVASPLFPTKNLPRTRDFEALGNGFPCLCFSRDSWHGTGKLGTLTHLASQNDGFLILDFGFWMEQGNYTPFKI